MEKTKNDMGDTIRNDLTIREAERRGGTRYKIEASLHTTGRLRPAGNKTTNPTFFLCKLDNDESKLLPYWSESFFTGVKWKLILVFGITDFKQSQARLRTICTHSNFIEKILSEL